MNRRDFIRSAAAFVSGRAALAERRPLNLLFIMTDQQRFDALSCAGNSILSTPHLDRLAREGAMFRNAVTGCPVCVPARTIMLTGKSSANTRVFGNNAAGDTELNAGPSFDNLLHERGYKTQYYGKWHAPYAMARTYDNKVLPVGARIEGVTSQRDYYINYLDKHVPAREPRPGELVDPGSNRPYTPAILDSRYEEAQRAKGAARASVETGPGRRRRRERASQAEVYGLLHIPREHSRVALTVNDAIRALEQMRDGPFSLTCSIGPPHPPMLNVVPYWGMYPADEMPLPKNFSHDMTHSPYRERAATMTRCQKPENIRSMISIYYGMVKEVDDNVGRLLRRLDELGLAGRTLVIFTSDHGEMLGSHGMHGKANFYEESVHVPLLMRLPGAIRPSTVVTNPVSQSDLFPTILHYLGLAIPPCDGRSLRPLLEGRIGDHPDSCVSEWAAGNVPHLMVRTRDWKLMIADSPDSKARDALFNLKDDPYEMVSLLGTPGDRASYRKQAEEMRERLVTWLQRVRSPRLEGVKQRRLA